MKLKTILGWSSALCLCANIVQAQETNEVEQLKQKLQQLQQNYEKTDSEQQQQIEALTKKLDGLTAQRAASSNSVPTNAATQAQVKELSEKVEGVAEAQKKTLLSEFNPAIGFVGEVIFSQQSTGSPQNGTGYPGGFDVFLRSMELNASASVDPFAKGWVVVNGSADAATGETSLDVEEAALQTTSLPGNLTLTAGQFFGEFGRLAYIHDHELPFVNRPMVLDQYIGGESKTYGGQLNWLVPIEHYVNLTAGLGTQFGDSLDVVGSYRTFGEVNYWSRLSTYFDLSDNWQLECGVSGLINPDAGNVDAQLQPDGVTRLTETRRLLTGADLKLSYVPLRDNQFNSLTWGTEVLYSDNQYLAENTITTSTANETVGSWGMYSYVTYKWSRRWSGGFLFEFLQSDENSSAETFGYSPYITWAISHWNQLRLQYTHTQPDAATGNQPNDAVYLQWVWIIGSHSHGWQQR